LETFCRKHGDLLKGKMIVYKHMEHWDIGPQDSLKTQEGPLRNLMWMSKTMERNDAGDRSIRRANRRS
jgi:hypothetical protein